MTKKEAFKRLDYKKIESQKNSIIFLQSIGQYPKKFDFPLLLQLELTRKCNVFCKHCYNNSGVNNSIEDDMTPDRWKQFAHYIVENGGIFECILSGGEPLLLGNDLFDIMDIFHEDGTYFLLITNGYLLNRQTVKKLEKYRYKWIQVSIDGANAEYHDGFRQRKGSWERAVKGAYMISEAGIPLTIAHSVSPQNLMDIDKMCDLAYSLGAGNIILGSISLSGRTYQNSNLILNDDETEYLLNKIEYNSQRYAGKMTVQRSMDEDLQYEQNIDTPCGGLIIRPNGDVRMDCMIPFSIGNILKDDFKNLWNTKAIGCWSNNKVKEYINCKDKSIRNYVDKDIII